MRPQSEAARLFSTEEPLYAFGDMDDDGKRRLRVLPKDVFISNEYSEKRTQSERE